jgi:hypothetical protein
MAKSEHEYMVIEIGTTLTSPTPSVKIMSYASQGWDVQQIFTGHPPGEGDQTFALLRRKRD